MRSDKCDIGDGPRRWFCSKCGSSLATTLDYDAGPMFIKAGSIDKFDSVFVSQPQDDSARSARLTSRQPEVKVHLFAPEDSSAMKKSWNFDGQTLLKGMPGSEQVNL